MYQTSECRQSTFSEVLFFELSTKGQKKAVLFIRGYILTPNSLIHCNWVRRMITKKSQEARKHIQMIDLESLVPEKHILRKIDEIIDFEFIREIVKEHYSEDKGRPSIDPVALIKIVFIQFLFGIKSMRQTIKEIEVNVAYRWFLGYGFTCNKNRSDTLIRPQTVDKLVLQ